MTAGATVTDSNYGLTSKDIIGKIKDRLKKWFKRRK